MTKFFHDMKEIKNQARELHHQGYNCAQSVLLSLAHLLQLDKETAARISSGLGGGVGACGEICGAANAMAMAESYLHSAEPKEKAKAAAAVNPLIRRFMEENGGRINCRELKGKADCRSCDELIEQGVGIFLENHPELLEKHDALSR